MKARLVLGTLSLLALAAPARADGRSERRSRLDVRVAGTWLEVEDRDTTPLPIVVRTGMMPLPSVAAINTGSQRIVGATGAEAAGLLGGSAMGSSLTVGLPARLGELSGGVYDPSAFSASDGLAPSYLAGARLFLSPLAALLPRAKSTPLKVFASTEDGAVATATRGRRDVVGWSVDHRLAVFGADVARARGLSGDPQLAARTSGAFFVLRPSRWFEPFVRYDVVDSTERARFVTAGLTVRTPAIKRLANGVDVLLTYRRVAGEDASLAPTDALTSQQQMRVNLNVRF